MKKLVKIIAVLTAVVFVLVGCSTKNASENKNKKINIVTSLNFYKEVAEKIAKDKAEVSSIISTQSVDPHDFEPTAKDAEKVSKADVVVYNGGGYDSWFEKMTTNAKNAKKIDAGKLLGLKDGDNEHIWYNYTVMEKVADEVAKILSEKDNANKEFYEKNRDNYKKELQKIGDKINSLKEKAKGKYVLTTEPVFDYAVENLGLMQTAEVKKLAQATEEGNDPAPKDLQEINNDIKTKKIMLVINNTQTTNKTVETLLKTAESVKTPILNVTETQPEGKTYIEWMISQYEKLEEILNGGNGEIAHKEEGAKEHHHDHDHDHDHDHKKEEKH